MNYRHSTRYDLNLVRELRRRLQFWLFALLVIAGAGVVGYRIFEHCSWLEAAYKSLCVLTTLGLSMPPSTPQSTAFTLIFIFAGIGSFAFAVNAVVRVMVSDDFQHAVQRRKVLRRMNKLNQHYIICGYGRIGTIVARHLSAKGLPCVLIERDEQVFLRLEDDGLIGLNGDASHEPMLVQAGLNRARAVIVVTRNDADNLLITMTARQLNPKIPIVVRCDEESNAPKFMRAGATRVITINNIGARQIALAATKPFVIDLFELAVGGAEQEFEIRQLHVPPGFPAHGKSLREMAFGSRFGVIVIGIKSQGREMLFNPSAEARLAAEDVLVTVGRDEKFKELEEFLSGARP